MTANQSSIPAWLKPSFLINILFHFLVITSPFIFTWVNEELFEFSKMLWIYGLTILVGMVWLIRMTLEKRLIVKRTPFDLPLLLFLLSQVLATIFSIHPRTSIFGYYTRFHGGLLSTMAYLVLFYALVSNLNFRQIKSLLISLFIAAIGVSLWAIPEHFGHSFSCWLITSRFDTACWVQDVQNRVYASFGQPNWLAAYLIGVIPVGLALYYLSLSKKAGFKISWFFWISWLKNLSAWLFGVGSMLLWLALLFTKSRSGLIGLAAGLMVFSAGYVWIKKGQRLTTIIKEATRIWGLWLLIMTLLALIFGTSFTPTLGQLIESKSINQTIDSLAITKNKEGGPKESPKVQPKTPVASNHDPGGTESGDIRQIVWQGAIKVWQRYPWFGSGVETFGYSYYQDRPLNHNLVSEWDFLYNKAHNELLNYLATTGLVGLVSYLILLGSIGWVGLKNLQTRQTKTRQFISLGLIAGITAMSASNFFGFSTVVISLLTYLYAASLAIMAIDSKAKLKTKGQTKTNQLTTPINLDWIQYLLLSLIIIVGSYLVLQVYRIWKADYYYAQGKNLTKANQLVAGSQYLRQAITKSPQEALYYDELANTYAKLAVQLASLGEATASAQTAEAAILTSQHALQLNPRHLNFYKTQARIYLSLAVLDANYLKQAKETLLKSIELAPTDPKLVYNLALVEFSLGNDKKGLEYLYKTIEMKPNYEAARYKLGTYFQEKGRLTEAKQQFQYILDYLSPINVEIAQRLEAIEASIEAGLSD